MVVLVSPKRFTAVSCENERLVATVSGSPGEAMDTSFADVKTGRVAIAHSIVYRQR